jgi:hypothetical protein
MKKLLTLLCTIAVAFALTLPVFAKAQGKGKGKAHKEAATTSEHGQAHEKHAKKKGATEGKKKGQQGTNPSEAPKH